MSFAVPTGTINVTSKVHEVPAVTVPNLKTMKVVPRSTDSAPHGLTGSGTTAVRPANTPWILPKESLKVIWVASVASLVLSRVNFRVTVPPGMTGSSVNSLLNVRPDTTSVSVPAFPVAVIKETVAVELLVVLIKLPGVAPAGTWRVTVMVHDALGVRVPPLNVSVGVPTPPTVPPQVFDTTLASVIPVTTAARSSVNIISVALVSAFPSWVRVNSSVTVPPGATGSSVKDFEIEGAETTIRLSVAACPVRVAASTVAVIVLVVFGKVPAATPTGTVRVTLKLHEAPAATLPPVKDRVCLSCETVSATAPPQGPAGRVADTGNGRKVVSSSVKATAVAGEVRLVFVIVNSRITSLPALTGLLVNILLKVGTGSTKRVSVAGSPVCIVPLISTVIELVVLTDMPTVAPSGTIRVMLKVHEPAAGRMPPLRVITLPNTVSIEPVPQTLLIGRPLGSRPEPTAEKSSVKVMPVA